MTQQPSQSEDSTSFWKGIRNLIAAATVLAAATTAVWYFAIRTDFQAAQPGDCLNVPASLGLGKDIRIVACDSSDAKSVVLGAVRGKHWDDIKQGAWEQLCKPWPETKAGILHAKRNAETGDVLCIKRAGR